MTNQIPTIILKPGKERALLRRHPWVYATGVSKVLGKPKSGETVRIQDSKGKFLAWGAYSPESALRARCWSFQEEDVIDAAWIEARVKAAIEARSCLRSRTNAIRLIFGEADFLPGLIVDQYNNQVVTQFQSAGVEYWRSVIGQALVKYIGCSQVYDRSDAATRAREGLPERKEVLEGEEPPQEVEIVEDGIKYGVDVRMGHKTGFYVDQRDNRALARRLAEEFKRVHGRGMRALNCFCYTGGFSVYAIRGGASRVVSVDSSAKAIALTDANVSLNFPDNAAGIHSSKAVDAFKYLGEMNRGEFDLIVLDPPAFAKHRGAIRNALRGYQRLNALGIDKVARGGIIFTFSCSQAISREQFRLAVFSAAAQTGRRVRILHQLTQPADHPVNIYHPEGEYLKGLILYVE